MASLTQFVLPLHTFQPRELQHFDSSIFCTNSTATASAAGIRTVKKRFLGRQKRSVFVAQRPAWKQEQSSLFVTYARYTDDADLSDRFFSCLPYLLPFIDSLGFARYIFQQFPDVARAIILPLQPVISIYRGIPGVGFALYIALFVFVVRNQNIPRFVRFNVMQALFLDVMLIIPGVFSNLSVARMAPALLGETMANAVFYATLAAVLYGVACSILGKLSDQIPLISESVKAQIGSF
mmetsp:Transcript_5635/g.9738  ORF Transcript_5635/g.9738 Transcript_5635/m.9738 type:complete len:237 (-) Transcript_5635:356-1066(-)